MANAALCEPYAYTIFAATAPAVGLANNLFNDEPGLVYQVAVNTAVGVTFDLGSARSVKMLAVLGLTPNAGTATWTASNASDMSSPVMAATSFPINLSSTRSATESKALLALPAGVTARYWRLNVSAIAAWAFRSWRVLICDAIIPAENIQIGAEEGIDDRSIRRYVRNGRRVIDPTVICPTFQGSWPWLTQAEAYGKIRPFIRRMGATKPALFVLDYADATYGEDGVFFGDMEKSSKIGFDEGFWSYSLAIVAIAP